ncbi:MAG: beta-ketoacyl synthase N-terminal-like domain-containing protein [Burkholderiaceae bacterium]
MTDPRPGLETLSPVKRALLEIRDLKGQLARAQGALHEPIAIVGMGLRLPGGVHDAESFAELLWSGTDAIGAIPPERWSLDALYSDDPDTPGKMTTRFGGFLGDVDRFDAEFFGISPREAASMDPQQRLLLQVGWEALEDAGYASAGLAGTRCGVYIGASNNDYGRALYAHPELIDAYFSTGNAYSVLSGRLSYFLGVHGPSLAIDTACSSSLVALHQACQALRLGDCDMALAGAVNLILTPEMNINFSRARMMSPDGRCKTFDAAADGYVRGEGCAVLVLRRLSDALAQGDRVLAVVRGSALNQDGRSGGLTAPNGPAQEAVLRAALASAQVPAAAIGYVEAHGTGTPLGDPIEVGALGAVLGEGRAADRPLPIGSVKTNIGHLEAAAGMAGVIKVVLALQRREIPPHLHFHTGNPHIDWASLAITVPTRVMPWAPIDGRRLAGVSSFGFSGTNAHVIIEEAPSLQATVQPQERALHLLALSARDDTTLRELARRYEASLADASLPVADICFTASAGRTHFSHRLAVVGATADELRRGLAHAATGRIEGVARPQVAFLFTGQGAQYAGMGRRLYDTAPVFKRALDECARLLEPQLERGLLSVIFAQPGEDTPVNETAYAQPATFAIEYALAALWRSWGIEPVAVMGHSLGEYAAACVAGTLSLADALRLVTERGRLTHALPANGAMAAIFATESIVTAELARGGGALAIAAYNGPEHFVVSGLRSEVEAALARLEASGVRVKLLRVPHAAHSRWIEPVLPEFRKALETVTFHAPQIAIVSNVSGAVAGIEEIGRPDYWLTHMRQPVRFVQSMQALMAQGVTHFIEVGPHPVLLGMGAECVAGADLEWLPSLHRERADGSDLLEGLQRLYVGGADVNWAGVDADPARRRVALPTYPFRERRHWMDVVGQAASPPVSAAERWVAITGALASQAERGPLDLNASSYPAKWACLERVTSAHAASTLRDAGLFRVAGERHTLTQVLERARIAGTYGHLIQRWLERLVAQGLLQRDADVFVAPAPLAAPDLPALWAEAEALFVDNQPLLAYVRHCGGLVGEVLSGAESPLETLFPGGSFDLAEGLYERSTTMRYINGLAASAFAALGASVPAGRSLRVLEIGAGTGGTSSALLPALPADRTTYRFTDVSDFFLDRARTRFAAYPFMSFGLLDMDQDPLAQGYAPHSFDVIVSANAVHASRDLRLTLVRLHDLLAPGGVLVLVESTVHMAWFDMSTGLIEGWQHFADDLRTDNPLLPPDTWVQALRDAGFDAAGAWPEAGSVAGSLGQHVVVARVTGDAVGESAGGHAASDESVPELDTPRAASAQEQAALIQQRVADALPAERIELLRDFVRDRVVRVLRLDANDPPGRHDRLMDLGFDSLMAVQLRNQLGAGLGLAKALPATLMFDYPTIDALAVHLLTRLTPPVQGDAAPVGAESAHTPALLGEAAVAAMSDADIEALLLDRLGKQ